MSETATYSCSICEAGSRDICVLCTKDACPNHLCLRCRRCIDCCICEMPRTAATLNEAAPLAGSPQDNGHSNPG